jgi:hypothetical protein
MDAVHHCRVVEVILVQAILARPSLTKKRKKSLTETENFLKVSALSH